MPPGQKVLFRPEAERQAFALIFRRQPAAAKDQHPRGESAVFAVQGIRSEPSPLPAWVRERDNVGLHTQFALRRQLRCHLPNAAPMREHTRQTTARLASSELAMAYWNVRAEHRPLRRSVHRNSATSDRAP